MPRLLVVEDEKKTASFIVKTLEAEGYAVAVRSNGDEALDAALTSAYDAIVLDIMLPGRDGLSIVRALRARKMTVPVLLLTARGSVAERVEGLDAGADDYLPKPFALEELLARVRAMVRRRGEIEQDVLTVGDLTLDVRMRSATRNGEKFNLTSTEFRLLQFLMAHPNQPQGRQMLLQKVWDYDFDPGTNLVDVAVRRLRQKVDSNFDVKLIRSVPGVGYYISTKP